MQKHVRVGEFLEADLSASEAFDALVDEFGIDGWRGGEPAFEFVEALTHAQQIGVGRICEETQAVGAAGAIAIDRDEMDVALRSGRRANHTISVERPPPRIGRKLGRGGAKLFHAFGPELTRCETAIDEEAVAGDE